MRMFRFLDLVIFATLFVLVPDNSASAKQPLDLSTFMVRYHAPAKPATPVSKKLVADNELYPEGTVVIKTHDHYLYYMLAGGEAIRYPIGVGRDGFKWKGTAVISDKKENPDWYPPPEMLRRHPELPRHMAGGRNNPLGERALYLKGTLYRIHGTSEPDSIGRDVSSGCIRMYNEHVKDLYQRVHIGTRVVVLP